MHRKNLLLIHLESISSTILWQYRMELATIWKIMQVSRVFTNYNSAATSTEMSVNAILYGTDALNDSFSSYGYGAEPPYPNPARLLDYLGKDLGYIYRRVFHDPFMLEHPADGNFTTRDLSEALKAVLDLLIEARETSKNFCLSFTDYMSHMAYETPEREKASEFSERFRLGYSMINNSIGMVLALLEENGFLDKTVIVFYGDHGDEMWSHSMKAGRCHTIEPYASITRTPLFIYDNGENAGVDSRLVCGVDLRETIIKYLDPDYTPSPALPPFDDIPFSGMDLEKNTRDYAFSQSLYALQPNLSDREKSVSKSYSVTDGTLRLVVDAGAGRIENGGMELYYERLDPTNSRNLLDFFEVNGDDIRFAPPPAMEGGVFALLFTPAEADFIAGRYRELRRVLHERVRAKEQEALSRPRPPDAPYTLMPEQAFQQRRKRIRPDYLPGEGEDKE